MADHVDERPDDVESRPPGDVRRRSETVIDNPVDSSPEDDLVAQLLEHSLDVSILASAVDAQQPADAADTLETLDESEAADILEKMELDNAADALSHMVAPLAVSVLEDLGKDHVPAAACTEPTVHAGEVASKILLNLSRAFEASGNVEGIGPWKWIIRTVGRVGTIVWIITVRRIVTVGWVGTLGWVGTRTTAYARRLLNPCVSKLVIRRSLLAIS